MADISPLMKTDVPLDVPFKQPTCKSYWEKNTMNIIELAFFQINGMFHANRIYINKLMEVYQVPCTPCTMMFIFSSNFFSNFHVIAIESTVIITCERVKHEPNQINHCKPSHQEAEGPAGPQLVPSSQREAAS